MNDWLLGLLGGVLIGVSATLLLLLNGRIAGISGIVNGVMSRPSAGEWAWRAAFLVGLLGAGGIAIRLMHADTPSPAGIATLIVGGLLVGFGTSLGNGCTSGHGVCGLGRLSMRSLVAVLTFMLVAMVTVWIVRHGVSA